MREIPCNFAIIRDDYKFTSTTCRESITNNLVALKRNMKYTDSSNVNLKIEIRADSIHTPFPIEFTTQIINYFGYNKFPIVEEYNVVVDIGTVKDLNPYQVSAMLKFIRQDIDLDINLSFEDAIKKKASSLDFIYNLGSHAINYPDTTKLLAINMLKRINLTSFFNLNSSLLYLLYIFNKEKINEIIINIRDDENGIFNILLDCARDERDFFISLIKNYFSTYEKEILFKSYSHVTLRMNYAILNYKDIIENLGE